jgi:futalosine hydrolase
MSFDSVNHYPRRILIMAAVSAEADAVLRGLDGAPGFDIRIAGVGPALAAARTAAALWTAEYRMVISAGIGGGFSGQAEVGSLVVASEIVAADLGAETAEGFVSLDALGFGTARIAVDADLASKLTQALGAAGLPVRCGPVVTVSTVTGTAETARLRAAQVPGAAAEGMEGFGVAAAALDRGVAALEIRAISNAVGPRDRDAWRIKDALDALQAAFKILREVL